jgi:hypothetical protein
VTVKTDPALQGLADNLRAFRRAAQHSGFTSAEAIYLTGVWLQALVLAQRQSPDAARWSPEATHD